MSGFFACAPYGVRIRLRTAHGQQGCRSMSSGVELSVAPRHVKLQGAEVPQRLISDRSMRGNAGNVPCGLLERPFEEHGLLLLGNLSAGCLCSKTNVCLCFV